MRYYIDGHNVLGAMNIPGDERSIQILIAKLTAYQLARQVQLVLVFDNFKNDNPYVYFSRIGNLQVFASDPNVDPKGADDCLLRLLNNNPKVSTVTVVTADRELKDNLRAIGVKNFMAPLDFMQIVERALTSKSSFTPVVQDDTKDDDLTDQQRQEITDELSRKFGVSDDQGHS